VAVCVSVKGEQAMPVTDTVPAFGDVLRRFRMASGLSQEVLAVRAGLSARGISDLERGINRAPHRTTVDLLAKALGLHDCDCATLEAAAPRQRAGHPRRRRGGSLGIQAAWLIPLFGRDQDYAAVGRLLIVEGKRLVTLTGPGGVGKTSLADAVAMAHGEHFDDGVVTVALATVREPEIVAATIADVLDLPTHGGGGTWKTLTIYLRSRSMLLVLHNLEQVLAAGPRLAQVLRACPCLQLLITSRSRLQIPGEHVYRLRPLELPDQHQSLTAAQVAQVPAVALFIERAQEVQPAFRLTAANVSAVVAICRRLDGLPLAVEKAAALVKLIPPPLLLARLTGQFALRLEGPPMAEERQQSLQRSFDWSYGLLTPDEQQLFRRLAVFTGGASLAAIEAVCSPDWQLRRPLLAALAGLLDKSLIVRHEVADTLSQTLKASEPRFTMLDTARAFALEQLQGTAEAAEMRERHLRYFLSLVKTPNVGMKEPALEERLAPLREDFGNFRGALDCALQHGYPRTEWLQLAAVVVYFWLGRGHVREVMSWLENALDYRCGARPVLQAWLH
jgi:predicted ATPase/transcriptional regulator with XRE-family HTH domain